MGFEVAKCLAQKNATVIIAARNLEKCKKWVSAQVQLRVRVCSYSVHTRTDLTGLQLRSRLREAKGGLKQCILT